jgi:glycosyltransferase involved in cell wall biosynthesis
MRALHVGRALKHVGDVSTCVVSADVSDDDAGDARSGEAADSERRGEFSVRVAIRPEVHPERGWIAKLRRAFDPTYLNVHGVVASPADRQRVLGLRDQFDLVWVLNSRTPNILHEWQWPGASHLDMDDVPSTYLRAVARNGDTLAGRCKARVQAALMKRRELRFRERFTTLSVCSEEDRRYLLGGTEEDRGQRSEVRGQTADNPALDVRPSTFDSGLAPIHVIPNGFERPSTPPVRVLDPAAPRIGFIGLYSYAPNFDGVRWFLQHCWPFIQRAIPGIRFRLAGKESNGPLRPSATEASDVDALGFVADAAQEIATWSAMVIPIRFGGGTRIKIADAFSRKCPVVSTSLGAYGYSVTDKVQLRLADTPDAFAAACVETVRDPEAAVAMAERAWTEFLEKWTWDAIAGRVWNAAEECLRRGKEVRGQRSEVRGRRPAP